MCFFVAEIYLQLKCKEYMKNAKKICILIICIMCALTGSTVLAVDIIDGGLYALSAVLMDGESGRILYEKEGYTIRPMASTTKIMTCIIALEYGDINSVVTVSKYAASMPDVQLNIKEGQQFVLKDLLYSLMLESHNDTAVVIAEGVAGSVEEFANLMNKKGTELGCKDTYFITPNGLDASKNIDGKEKLHSTTAADLAKIMRYCIKNDTFLEITRTGQKTFYDKKLDEAGSLVNGSSCYNVVNRNTLLKNLDGMISGKTGFTNDAGYCYVCAYENDGRTYIVALLGCGWPNNKNYKWEDTKKLLKYGTDNYQLKELFTDEIDLPSVGVLNGVYGEYYDFGVKGISNNYKINVDTYMDRGSIKALLSEEEQIKPIINIKKTVEAPVKKGQVIGKVRYILGNGLEKEYKIRIANDIAKKDYTWSFGVVFMRFILH